MSSAALPRTQTRGAGRTLRDRLRSVAEAAVTPLELSDVLDVFHPLRASAELRGRIVKIVPETAEAATVVIKPGKAWTGHVPGQYVRMGVDVDGVRLWRTYSLTHGPRPDGHISITVKAIPGGVVSNHLVHSARVGQFVQLAQAEGDFVLGDPHPAKLLLLTGGSGITPVIGMLRNLFSKAEPARLDIVLVHAAGRRPEVIFGRELRAHHDRGLLKLVEVHTDTHGRLDPAHPEAGLEALVPDLAERVAYACGPAGLLDGLEKLYADRGLELRTERFRPPRLATDGEGGAVTFASGPEVEVEAGTPILDAAEAAGVLMPSGCRMGICMGCVLPLTEGAVRDLRNGALTVAVPGETGPGGVPIQTCISAPAGACSIDH